MNIFNPLGSVIELVSKVAAQKIISGEMTRVEAFEYADKLAQEIVETDTYKQACKKVWDAYADIKDIPFGDKIEFSTSINDFRA